VCRNMILKSEGVIITESSKADLLPEMISCFRMFRQQKYGDTMLSFYRMESGDFTSGEGQCYQKGG